ncbi:hypothetical protein UFOVP19_57 [uncultured Caudovirales phage]|uniref:Uncharacterized protein n=1 Tax=uncultured Caudovirales phage TaxID=2100421 RepID=A0A6J5KPI1_9CAUD|nr:hypothetical protein UFOVP19_57 [uncultured Caudovirales phage]
MEIIVTNKPAEVDPKELVLMELINGRPPANDAEITIVSQLNEAKKQGLVIDIPSSL